MKELYFEFEWASFVKIRESFKNRIRRSYCVFELDYAFVEMTLVRMCIFRVKYNLGSNSKIEVKK